MSESPFDTRLLPGAINTDRGPSSSSPYSFSFLATAFQSIQVSFKGCALFLPNFPDTERWQIENVKGAPGDLHSPPRSLLSVVPTTVREVSWMYSSTNFYNIDGAACFLVMK